MNQEESEFVAAIEEYKIEQDKLFLSWVEVLQIVKDLGYSRNSTAVNKRTSNIDEVLCHLRNGNRARVADWDENEFIQYSPTKAVTTETDEECNAMVFIVNNEWELISPIDDSN